MHGYLYYKGGTNVKIRTVNNTFTVNQRSGSTTITGTNVVNVPQRSGTITIASQFYLITLLNSECKCDA